MKALRYLLYVLACQLYCLRLALYLVHSALVFLAKPGARLVVVIVALIVIYLARDLIDALIGPTIEAFWEGAARPILGPELYGLLAPLKIEVSAALALLLLALALGLLSSMLRPIVGSFAAPRQPLPPQPPMIVPDTQVRTVTARIAVPKRDRSRFHGDLHQLLGRVPDHVRQVVETSRAAD
jgi:hypothetical protein